MTSYCYVKNSVYPVTMTTKRHCSILEFVRGASNQAVAPGITRPLHATANHVLPQRYTCKTKHHFPQPTQLRLPHVNDNSSTKVKTIHMKEFHLDRETSRLLIAN